MTDVIDSFRGVYAFLSNFHVEPDGLTLEHRFQAAKSFSEEDQRFILSAPSPSEAKARGRVVNLRPDWEEAKDDVMLHLLRKKFAPLSDLGQRLLDTHPAELKEGNTWGDRYWGVDWITGRGQNRLGELLMQVREELFQALGDENEVYEDLRDEYEGGDW